MNPPVLLRDVEVQGAAVDVRLHHGVVAAIGPGLRPSAADTVIHGGGGALLPGLHDHHLHLLACAAAAESVAAGPPEVEDRASLGRVLHEADGRLAPGAWLRAVGYHEAVAGDLDRHGLDALSPPRPVRLQHRSGARWTLNSLAIDRLALAEHAHPGIERDSAGGPTGRVHRADDLLAGLIEADPPELAPLGARLATYGVIGVTDATPYRRRSELAALAEAVRTGALPQRVTVTGGIDLLGVDLPEGLGRGPVKVIIDDGAYPALVTLASDIALAHAAGRPVAIHCVTRPAAVLALAAWDEAGTHRGDRMEHGSVLAPEQVAHLARHGITVVTQPGFIAERGDDYQREVDADDQDHLYRCASLLAAGVPVGGSTDAPYTHADPWRAMRAAVDRRTRHAVALGPAERISARAALGLFLGASDHPGGAERTVAVGHPADLCLLRVPLATALAQLTAENVAATVCAGQVIYEAS